MDEHLTSVVVVDDDDDNSSGDGGCVVVASSFSQSPKSRSGNGDDNCLVDDDRRSGGGRLGNDSVSNDFASIQNISPLHPQIELVVAVSFVCCTMMRGAEQHTHKSQPTPKN